MKTKQIGLIALLAIITLALIACKEDEPKCECPNGTIHLVGETCCEGVNCNCEKNVVGQRVEGIPVTSRGGDHTKAIEKISEILTGDDYLSTSEREIIKNNVKDIQVKPEGTTATFKENNGKYIVVCAENAGINAIANIFYDILDELEN